ncbi:MAG TPA: SDR family oxidoreductase [Candidatus Eisenbergiella merdipullorum]|uniref:SDR family oxidoreductase n=1 Tax=Candidatus Eisenbergiella merdipullorum TaxID=2838553 RepID=A0A9D2I2Y5_9FIRM|nr:SDR family oxidoreductase [Candidatus Eisenbergiella merdipullorum]
MDERKTVLITGASRGLGLCFARKYLEGGWRVLAGARSGKNLEELKKDYPDRLFCLPLDVTDTASVEEAAKKAGQYADRVELIINNAGIHSASSFEPLEKTDLDDCAEVYEVNAVGPLRVVKAFLELIPENGDGLIANISSESGSIGTAQRVKEFDYCMSKAAMNMGTKLLDNYLRPRGIRVIAVHPGWMRTDMGGENADLDPYETAGRLAGLFERFDRNSEFIFMDNEGNALLF